MQENGGKTLKGPFDREQWECVKKHQVCTVDISSIMLKKWQQFTLH
jgi:hypothetical protein